MKHLDVKTEKETKNIAKAFAKDVELGAVVALIGDLGAGKTVFAKAFSKELGVKEEVISPTFNIIKTYQIKNSKKNVRVFCHVDAYRLNSYQELLEIGIEEYLNDKNTIVLIEWADKVEELLPKDVQIIRIEHKEDTKRVFYFDNK
ncbi:MAG TPA: tRNA (adenosine(37)-N6)-threonylcarbamoyltransferase complex ATPase subunit type 1 TsaE [Patescibacteria group bacterium]|nr:tRNA (adenosine(37)-N6)-threonylcarbamoyltransferase complex ATPase subunit type 1 TsaE [Patescibacteria group bacterium]